MLIRYQIKLYKEFRLMSTYINSFFSGIKQISI